MNASIVRSKAPLRLGLAGGGTDVSPYSDTFGGRVLNATISLYARCTIRSNPYERIVIRMLDLHEELEFDRVEHRLLPVEGNLCAAVYNRMVLDFGIETGGLEITVFSDAPPGSGLGSSSAMVVSIVSAFVEMFDLPLGEYDIARLAYSIEREDLGMEGGKQDQYAATFGGFNFMEFLPNDQVIVNPLKVKPWIVNELEDSILLYYIGASRDSSEIIRDQQIGLKQRDVQVVSSMHLLKEGAYQMKSAILKGDFDLCAKLLGESWNQKKQLAKSITNSEIDTIIDCALMHGAISAKVSGAGGGGFIIFYVDPINKTRLKKLLKDKAGLVYEFNFTDNGCVSWKIN